MFGLGIQEVVIIGVVAVLLYGKRLPEVARSLGSSYRDFRQGLNDIQSQMDVSNVYRSTPTYSEPPRLDDMDDSETPTAPSFELPKRSESSPNRGD